MGSLASPTPSHLIARGPNRIREVRIQLCNTITTHCTTVSHLPSSTTSCRIESSLVHNTPPLHYRISSLSRMSPYSCMSPCTPPVFPLFSCTASLYSLAPFIPDCSVVNRRVERAAFDWLANSVRPAPAVKTATEVGVRAIQDHKVIEWNTCWKCRLSEGTGDK